MTVAGGGVRQRRQACFIAGEWVSGERWLDVDDPATGEAVGQVPALGIAEARRAIEAAAAAYPRWAARPAGERAACLKRIGDLMISERDRLAQLITEEQGKPVAEARDEVDYAASYFRWFAEEARRI